METADVNAHQGVMASIPYFPFVANETTLLGKRICIIGAQAQFLNKYIKVTMTLKCSLSKTTLPFYKSLSFSMRNSPLVIWRIKHSPSLRRDLQVNQVLFLGRCKKNDSACYMLGRPELQPVNYFHMKCSKGFAFSVEALGVWQPLRCSPLALQAAYVGASWRSR